MCSSAQVISGKLIKKTMAESINFRGVTENISFSTGRAGSKVRPSPFRPSLSLLALSVMRAGSKVPAPFFPRHLHFHCSVQTTATLHISSVCGVCLRTFTFSSYVPREP